MRTVKAQIELEDEALIVVPVIIPDIGEVKAFANQPHTKNQKWEGEAFGWQAEYTPEHSNAPLDSNMTFTPADFCIGQSEIWFYSLMWEQGKDNEPVEYLDERNILEEFNINEPYATLISSTT